MSPSEAPVDVDCCSGSDLLIAVQMTGPDGRVIGVDMTPAMLARAHASAVQMGLANLELHESLIETLPLADSSVGVVISNGAIDLVPDKDPSSTRSTVSCDPAGACRWPT